MKKLFVMAVLAGVLVSCNLFQESTVINKSSRQITFQLSVSDPKIITLNPDESASVDGGFGKVENLKPEKRLSQTWSTGNIITITDIIPLEVRVENVLSVKVTLSADGWMEDMVDIPPGSFIDDNTHKGLIYTQIPVFSISSDLYLFPIKIDHEFINNIFYVKIY